LQLLDLSGNRLNAVFASLANLRLDVSRNEIPLRVSPRVIKALAKSGKDLWMMDTELANREPHRAANGRDVDRKRDRWILVPRPGETQLASHSRAVLAGCHVRL